MNTSYNFAASAVWTEDRRGLAAGEPTASRIEFSAPPEFQGPAGFWTPEHFFLAAVATCFVTTFQAIAEFSKFDALALDVEAEGTVEKSVDGFRFTRVVVRPLLTIHSEEDRERAMRLLDKTERSCLVSRSLKSEIVLEPRVEIAQVITAA